MIETVELAQSMDVSLRGLIFVGPRMYQNHGAYTPLYPRNGTLENSPKDPSHGISTFALK
ncbi:hypothetical protein [Cupriavidus sp. M-11]|uniref:hypothetical protein n=1 Tax=Cupriavidus sp. M-11 TaxID=3233038 RepID=UPI003F8DC1D6